MLAADANKIFNSVKVTSVAMNQRQKKAVDAFMDHETSATYTPQTNHDPAFNAVSFECPSITAFF